MKTKNVVFFLALVTVLFQGCIPSLHPLYTKDKLVMKKEILGTWVDDQEGDMENLKLLSDGKPIAKDPSKTTPGVWTFETDDEDKYYLKLYDEERRVAAFEAHLMKLGTNYYFDFYPRTTKEEAKEQGELELFPVKFNGFEAYHYYPVHTFAKATITEDEITIALFNGELLDELLKEKRIRIKHEETDQGFIFTAQPEELQQFIIKYAEDEKAFLDPINTEKASLINLLKFTSFFLTEKQ